MLLVKNDNKRNHYSKVLLSNYCKKFRKVFRKAIVREAFLRKVVTTILLRIDTLHGDYFPRNFVKLLRIPILFEAKDSNRFFGNFK